MKFLATIVTALLLVACSRTPADPPPDPAYRAEIEAWQQYHREGMKRDWGTLAGLFWLSPGENAFGSDPKNAVVLTKEGIPPQAGVLKLEDGKASVKFSPDADFTLNGKPVREATLKTDANDEQPDILEHGSLSMWVLDREGRFGIRVRDTEGPLVAKFPHLEYFPIRERYRVIGRLIRSSEPKKMTVPAENMGTQTIIVPGRVEFTLEGKQLSLVPSLEGERLFYIFKDKTSESRETYPAARYLYSEIGPNDEVVLDFNRAYSPPCAFTPYATCPLTPPENELPLAIEAGEKYTHP